MAISYEVNHERTERDGIPWLDEAGTQPRKSHDWAQKLPDGNTVWGRIMRAVRVGQGLTQVQVAERLGVTARTVHNWESGRVVPPKRKARIYWRQTTGANGAE